MATYKYDQLQPDHATVPLHNLPQRSIQRKPLPTQSISTVVQQDADASQYSETYSKRAITEKTTRWQRFQRSRANTWFEEYLALGIAVLCLAGLIGMFIGIHDRPLSIWHASAQPNTVVAIIVTIMDMALALCLASALGQLKWIRLSSRSQTLSDLQGLDSASRGALGSIDLLFSRGAGKLGMSGAAVLLLLLAVGPFAQQVLKFPGALVPENTPAIASSAMLFNEGLSVAGTDAFATLGMQSSIYAALGNGANESNVMQAPFDCPTSNCTWPTFETLGLCGSCMNITNLLTKTSYGNGSLQYINYTLPTQYAGLFMWKQAPGISPSGSNDNLMTIQPVINQYGAPMWPAYKPALNIAMINSSAYNNSRVSATSCQINFCVQSVQANVTNGLLTETRSPVPFQYKNITLMYDDVLLVTNKSSFYVSSMASAGLAKTLSTYFTGSVYLKFIDRPNPDILFTRDTMTAVFSQNTTSLMHLLTTSMSTHMRNANDSSHTGGTQNVSGAAVFGTSYRLEQSFEVRWPWLILPALSVIFATVFFFSVVIQTRKTGASLWKNNLVALLLHGLDTDTRRNFEHEVVDDVYGMSKISQRVSLRMRRGDTGQLALSEG